MSEHHQRARYRKRMIGTVVSDANDKTRVIEIVEHYRPRPTASSSSVRSSTLTTRRTSPTRATRPDHRDPPALQAQALGLMQVERAV